MIGRMRLALAHLAIATTTLSSSALARVPFHPVQPERRAPHAATIAPATDDGGLPKSGDAQDPTCSDDDRLAMIRGLPITSWDFESGLQGWVPTDLSTVAVTSTQLVNLSTVPGSIGNGALFTGKVAWTGGLGGAGCAGSTACYPGYANNGRQIYFKTFIVGIGDSLSFAYRSDSEAGFDKTFVIVSRGGAPIPQGGGSYSFAGTESQRDTLATYSGSVQGTAKFDLASYANTTVTIIFDGETDEAVSDSDCGYDAHDGLFESDDVRVGGDLTTWDAGFNGWTAGWVAGVGTFAAVQPLAGLPNDDLCSSSTTCCGLSGNVVTFYDSAEPNFHADRQHDVIVSPVVDVTGLTSWLQLSFDVYANLPMAQGNYFVWHVRYSPVEAGSCACLDAGSWSPWLDENLQFYNDSSPSCLSRQAIDLSTVVPGHATKIQIALGVINYPMYATAPGGNQSPYIDNVTLMGDVASSGPSLTLLPFEMLQDSYPNAPSFLLAKSTPARVDAALNIAPNRTKTRLGDSTLCHVGLSCDPARAVEVDYLFKVTPGPCLNTSHPWWAAYTSQPKIATGRYAGFAVARADTVLEGKQLAGKFSPRGTFASVFHESPPASGTVYAGLGNWSAYTGGDGTHTIFPDDLFTPGTHIEWVVHATFVPATAADTYYPDPAWGNLDGDRAGNLMGNERWLSQNGTYDPTATFVEEFAVLPLTTMDGSTPNAANCAAAMPAHCFLYVDHADQRGPQTAIENAFRNLGVTWDRFDVRAPTSKMGNGLGTRFDTANYLPADHASGPHPALLREVYNTILWNTGDLAATNFSFGGTASGAEAGNDVGLLDGWLRLASSTHYLWASGDGTARFLNAPGARIAFLNQDLGVTYVGPQYRDKSTAWGVSLIGLGPDCTAGLNYGLRANWCPDRRSFNLLGAYTGSGASGVASVNFRYPNAGGTWYGAVQNVASTGGFHFRTQTDAWSLEQLRQVGITGDLGATNENIAAWTARALSTCATDCFAGLTVTAASPPEHSASTAGSFEVRMRDDSRRAEAIFAVPVSGRVRIELFDAAGRLQRRVVDEVLPAGRYARELELGPYARGVFFVHCEAPGVTRARRLLLLR